MSEWLVRHGGKRALLKTACTPLLVAATPWRRFAAPIKLSPHRIVFVCAGNICRSPFAEHLARQRGLNAVSMGLRAGRGQPANATAVRVAAVFGVDLASHLSRPIDVANLRQGDLLLGFELWHACALEVVQPEGTVRLVGSFAGLAHCHLYDPYGLPDVSFEYCFHRIERAVSALADTMPSLRRKGAE